MVILTEVLEASSSSPSTYDHKYDVFLSFRGLDTRLNFTNHLHEALKNANLETFLDDEEIETGLYLKPELESAIKASRASIVVLSENYASSTWCLDELALILNQHWTSGHIVIPIFYHVEPTNIRKQQSSFGDAMTKHRERMEEETNEKEKSRLAQKMEIWKKSLTEVANLKGKDARGRLETEFLEEIVKDIYHRLGVPLRSTPPLPIGRDYSIKFITSWLKDGSSHTADILTILGMGGIGKTSLARYVHALHRRVFDKSSFVQDISRRCSEKNRILDLQKQLCGDISKTSPIQVHDVSLYTSKIENALARKKVFLVLDDIDSLEQLDALLGSKGFHPGSKVIITTKDASLIERCALFNLIVQPKHTKHLLRGLYETESLRLLSFHAFMCNNPKEGYEEVSKELVKYCGGHPLALEVLGRSLRNRHVAYWEERIEGLKKETDSHINNVLRMSFDSLPSKNDKELFKHIACFFVGEDRDFTETILKACGILTLIGINNLIDKCLLRIEPTNELVMHQLLQEMGKDVVRQESLDKPWKRSRLWCHEESFKVLKQKKGKGNLLGLALDMTMLEKKKLRGSLELETDALSKMDNLMLLKLNYVQLNGSYKNFPEELRWLCMRGFPLKSIPSDLRMENLVALDMSYSNIESFDVSYSNQQRPGKRQKLIGSCSKDKRLLGSLKILDLTFCYQLHSLGGFFELPALERLILANCTSLIEVCESIEQCDELVLIDLSYCNKLKKLLRTIGKLKKVQTLLLEGCNLGKFATEIRDMDSLEMLKANSIDINSQTSSSAIVEAIPRDLKSFSISLPSSLVELVLTNNNLSDESFPMDLSSLSMLETLELKENPIVSLPNCVRSLRKLAGLNLEECDMLKTIEHPPCTLRWLMFEGCYSLEKIVLDPEMPSLILPQSTYLLPHSLIEIEGMVKTQPIAHVEEEVLRSLGWTNLEFIRNQEVETCQRWRGRLESRAKETKIRNGMTGRHMYGDQDLENWNDWGGTQKSRVQMYYEFGIFSTFYGGKEVPDWISHRNNGSSISFTMPPSPNYLRGLNFCYVQTGRDLDDSVKLLTIIVSNKTKNLTWIYGHYIYWVKVDEECVIWLSHWMLGENEMEDGDQVTVTIAKEDISANVSIRECGISLVYDDGNMEEDPLGYYKSWNHIIGGDLSGFRLTTGEYILDFVQFFSGRSYIFDPIYHSIVADGACFEEEIHYFTAFSQWKSDELDGTPEDVTE